MIGAEQNKARMLRRTGKINSKAVRRSATPALVWTAAVLLAGGCATYELDLSRYPGEKRILYLHNITNDTFQPDANVELTEWVRREFHRRKNFRLATDRKAAPLWLYTKIRVYRKEGRMYDNAREPVRFDLTVVARVRLRRNPAFGSEELLDSEDIAASLEYSEREGYSESEFGARQRLLRLLAARINNRVERVFIENSPAPPPVAPEPAEK